MEQIYLLPHSPTKSSVVWLPVVWNHADVWRKSVGLAPKSYHITMSEADDHSLDKSVAAHFRASGTLEKALEAATQIGIDALDHLVVSLAEEHASSMQGAEQMISAFPRSYKGYLRLADAALAANPKLAALSYAQALTHDLSLLEPVSQRIRKLSDIVSYGPIVTAKETENIPAALHQHLIRPWASELDAALSQTLWTAPTTSRERNSYLGRELPRFFSWVFPGRVAGMSTPRHAGDISALIDMGFTHVLSLTAESPLDPAWFHLKPLRHVYVPLPNYGAPTLQEMDAILEEIGEGGAWLVHCGGGVGRAGTVLACLMTMLGRSGVAGSEPQMDAKAAISLLRQMRPRSLESETQERFVSAFVSHRWKTAYEAPHGAEPSTELRISPASCASSAATPDVIFMVGKPGSGKSWLASAIAKRRGRTVVINQDNDGRSACEGQFARNRPEDTLVILDRCNSRRHDRAEWLKLVPHGRRCIVVYFDYQTSVCRQRINRRLTHPTIRAGRGDNALDQMEREMEMPDLSEGFETMLHVSSFQAATQALVFLTPTPPLLKFPRTLHLLSTGASGEDDIVLPDFNVLFGRLTIEEKIDGANMGFSLDVQGGLRSQNRSHWVNAADHAQFKPLSRWLDVHGAALVKLLNQDPHFPERYILYGEWVVAKHSVHYTALPDVFLAFDMYDRLEASFLSRSMLASALQGSGIAQVPLIAELEALTRAEMLDMVQGQSAYAPGRREGVYVRFEDDARTQTVKRGKVVRSDFIAGSEHWTKAKLVLNGVASDASEMEGRD
ncbi:hypothetical protein FA10DRAFT_234876 [Acaromyces ingoldii]|uniref:Tyrosine specific protein phosphatases domain-containing protein n=1 Tax=Acaromyces ingoldii TaxID=215250 RepID=A0A316YBJ9_9BASI|nr:hypothetical protein FA10DRAFT_234876 [Acaromyces ingoldii]PWN86936.1 hypothetical protein FA10DRAFT_234876 [Acaromyces ingoldii]